MVISASRMIVIRVTSTFRGWSNSRRLPSAWCWVGVRCAVALERLMRRAAGLVVGVVGAGCGVCYCSKASRSAGSAVCDALHRLSCWVIVVRRTCLFGIWSRVQCSVMYSVIVVRNWGACCLWASMSPSLQWKIVEFECKKACYHSTHTHIFSQLNLH